MAMYGVKIIKNQEVPVISPLLGDAHISHWCNQRIFGV